MPDKTISKETADIGLFRGIIAEECVKNPDFAIAVKEDPQKAVSELFPDQDFSEVNFEVITEKPGSLVIPVPEISEDLTVEQLEAVAGGAFFGGIIGAVTVSGIAKGIGIAATIAGGVATTVNQSQQAQKN